MIGLQALGLNLSSLVVVGGALGIGVGLGLQAIVSNFVAGLILLLERPTKRGDRIEVDDTETWYGCGGETHGHSPTTT